MCSCVHVTHGYTYRQECERVIVSGTSFVFLASLPRALGGGSPGPLLSNLSSSTALMLRRRWRDGSSQGGRGSRPASLAQGVSNICLAMWLENHVLEGNHLVHHKTTWDKLDLIVCILFQGTEGKYLAIYDKSEAGVQVSRLLSVVPMMLRYFY